MFLKFHAPSPVELDVGIAYRTRHNTILAYPLTTYGGSEIYFNHNFIGHWGNNYEVERKASFCSRLKTRTHKFVCARVCVFVSVFVRVCVCLCECVCV